MASRLRRGGARCRQGVAVGTAAFGCAARLGCPAAAVPHNHGCRRPTLVQRSVIIKQDAGIAP
jgi:hypothetical protein